MAYEPYATPDFYLREYGGSLIPEEKLSSALRQASRHIDSLTFNRIVGQGISNLTPFQQDLIREVVCQQADFEYENADEINTILRIGPIWKLLECVHGTWCCHEKGCVHLVVSDRPMLPDIEVRP